MEDEYVSDANGHAARVGYLSIGAFSAASRLSQKALRLYDRHGLLRPALTDPCSGYRYYRAEQLTAAKRILLLREMEMPLARIRRLLAATPSEAACMIRTYQQEREARVARGRRAVGALLHDLRQSCDGEEKEAMDKTTAGAADALTVVGTEVVPQTVLGISRRIKVDVLDTHYRECLAKLRALVEAQSGVEAAGQPFAVYHGPVNNDDDGPMEVCLPVRGAVTPTGNVTAREMPGGPAALATGTGAYCEFPKVLEIYDRAFEWIKAQGGEPAGPPREYWTGAYGGQDDALRVIWPYRKAA